MSWRFGRVESLERVACETVVARQVAEKGAPRRKRARQRSAVQSASVQLGDHTPGLVSLNVSDQCLVHQLQKLTHVTCVAFDSVGTQSPLVGEMGDEPFQIPFVERYGWSPMEGSVFGVTLERHTHQFAQTSEVQRPHIGRKASRVLARHRQ